MGRRRKEAGGEGEMLSLVRELLSSTQNTALQIYAETGVAPNQQWAIQSGKTKDPSVNTVERLYTFLTGFKVREVHDTATRMFLADCQAEA